jgi:hypothetical protein
MQQRLYFFILLALLVIAQNSDAQSVVPSNIRATNTIDKLSDMRGLETGEMLFGIPLPEGKVIGDTYLDVQWKTGSIMLYDKDKLIERYPIRYDIHADELDIKTGKSVKVIAGNKIKSFSWIDSSYTVPIYFINAKDFKDEEGGSFSGFFEVLVDGTLPLLRKTDIVVKKADYNVQLNVGSTDDKILKKDIYYYLKDGKALEVPSSKKKLLALFGQHAEAVEKYIKENKGATKQRDLVLAFDYYKKLVKN